MDLEVNALSVRDETRFDRTGLATTYKIATFWIGNSGPFVETFVASEFNAGAFQARAQQLKTTLGLIGAK